MQKRIHQLCPLDRFSCVATLRSASLFRFLFLPDVPGSKKIRTLLKCSSLVSGSADLGHAASAVPRSGARGGSTMAGNPRFCRCEEFAAALEALIRRYLGDAGDETHQTCPEF